MEKKIEITASSHLYRGRIVAVRQDLVRVPGGKELWWEVVEHPGAAAVLARQGDQIYLIKQYRHPASRVLWEIPAGKIEPGEDPLSCARRELAEETGIRGNRWDLLTSFYPSPGFCDEIIYLYQVRDLQLGEAKPDEHEQVEVVKISLSTAIQMVAEGEIKDAKTMIALALVSSPMESA